MVLRSYKNEHLIGELHYEKLSGLLDEDLQLERFGDTTENMLFFSLRRTCWMAVALRRHKVRRQVKFVHGADRTRTKLTADIRIACRATSPLAHNSPQLTETYGEISAPRTFSPSVRLARSISRGQSISWDSDDVSRVSVMTSRVETRLEHETTRNDAVTSRVDDIVWRAVVCRFWGCWWSFFNGKILTPLVFF